MNTTRTRFAAIVANLAPDTQMDDSSTGIIITFWRDRKGNYYVARKDDTMAMFGYTERHTADSVVDAAMNICGL